MERSLKKGVATLGLVVVIVVVGWLWPLVGALPLPLPPVCSQLGPTTMCIYTTTTVEGAVLQIPENTTQASISVWGGGGGGASAICWYYMVGIGRLMLNSGGSGSAVIDYLMGPNDMLTIESIGAGGAGATQCGQAGANGGTTCVVITDGLTGLNCSLYGFGGGGGDYQGSGAGGGSGGVAVGSTAGPSAFIERITNACPLGYNGVEGAQGVWADNGVPGGHSGIVHGGSSGSSFWDALAPTGAWIPWGGAWGNPCLLVIGCFVLTPPPNQLLLSWAGAFAANGGNGAMFETSQGSGAGGLSIPCGDFQCPLSSKAWAYACDGCAQSTDGGSRGVALSYTFAEGTPPPFQRASSCWFFERGLFHPGSLVLPSPINPPIPQADTAYVPPLGGAGCSSSMTGSCASSMPLLLAKLSASCVRHRHCVFHGCFCMHPLRSNRRRPCGSQPKGLNE